MPQATVLTFAIPSDSPGDGRRARSQSSRDRIVAAVIQLVEGGDPSPSAAKVAEVAGVGLRSVFRHFDDMDTLYREVSERVAAEVMPMLREPVRGATWKERLNNVIDRRTMIFERIGPFRLSASYKRFRSAYLTEEYRRTLHIEHASVEGFLPAHVLADSLTTGSIKMILSFQNWCGLRTEQELSIEQARQVVRHLLNAVLSGLPD